jgi:hypothetical protein
MEDTALDEEGTGSSLGDFSSVIIGPENLAIFTALRSQMIVFRTNYFLPLICPKRTFYCEFVIIRYYTSTVLETMYEVLQYCSSFTVSPAKLVTQKDSNLHVSCLHVSRTVTHFWPAL